MAGVTLYAPGAGEEVRSTHVGQFVNLITGAASGGALVKLNDVSDSTSYSTIIGNQDTTNGYALKVQFGPAGSPTTLATFQKSSSRIQSVNGTHYLDVSNTGVALTGSVSFNGQSITRGLNVFNVLDYGVQTSTNAIEASAGTAVRAANNTAFETLMVALRAAGGGDIEFPPHAVNRFYPFNAPLTVSHTTGAGVSVGLRGHGQSSVLQFYGMNGSANGLDLGVGSSGSIWRQSHIRDLVLQADTVTVPTGGSLVRLQSVNGFEMGNLWMRHGWSGIEIGTPATTGVSNIPFHVRIRDVDLDLRSGSSGDAVKINAAAGVWILSSTFDGDSTLSTGLRVAPVGTNVTASGYSAMDSLWVVDSNFNGHLTDVVFGQSGLLANVFMSRTHFDGAGIGASSAYAVRIETAAAATVENVQISDPWVAVYATSASYGILLNDTTGIIRFVTIKGGYFTGAKTGAIVLAGSPQNVVIEGNVINGATLANNHEIDVAGGDGIVISGNRVSGPATSGYGVITASGVTNVVMVGNNATGKLTGNSLMAGATSSTRVFSANI